MERCKKTNNNSCCKIDPVQLGVTAAFIVIIGDFLAFIAALIAAQEQCNDTNIENNARNNKHYAEKRIGELEREIYKLKEEINYLDLNN
ncbi:hypothetical protein KQI42_20310 [Tissierella sp. MSJ-40]|uniref:Uncharacterized protein n=1 Tax=Tissierella simiarum TaxID=2841534 RepID=A0ABS6EBN7_9FIRM|nr:hypothetical protein [Tissierella simiarum]MBU5440343.1 hypothetical protein [Tissierella simiarum]